MKQVLFLILLLLSLNTYSQDANKLRRYKYQLGISSGADNSQYSDYIESNLSLHLISGSTAAIQGFQISGFSNRAFYYVNGMQLSSISNVSGKKTFKSEEMYKGMVLQGLQLASLLNKVEGAGVGVQMALFNRVTRSFEGFQLGLINSIERGGLGIQMGLLFNYAPKLNSLLQVGLFNYSFNAGFKAERKFFLSRDHFQIGLINKTKTNHGLQIGLINLSNKNEGVPIGLINTNSMYARTVFGGNELMNNFLTVAVGHPNLLNRVSIGYNYVYNKDVSWSAAYGLGLQFYTSPDSKVLFLSLYHDIEYHLKRGGKLKEGFWNNKTGLAITLDKLGKLNPLRLGITANLASKSMENFKLDLPLLTRFRSGHYFWPGIELGFVL